MNDNMTGMRRRPEKGSKALDYQMVQANNTITLTKRSRQALGASVGDWVSIYKGSKPGVLIIRLTPHADFEPEPDEEADDQSAED